jgi:methyltransferase (TIGR00027 family)
MKEGQPSQTAMLVAFRRIVASLDPILKPLLADPEEPYTGWFIEGHSPLARQQLEMLREGRSDHPFLRLLRQSAGERGGLMVLLRKRFVEDEVRAALADGAEQLVVFGAGYDALGVRLAPAFPSVRFFELDYPPTLAVKRAALESRSALPAGLALLPVDFSRESAEDKLRAAPGFRVGARAVFVAEGVLLYLAPPDVDALFALVHRLSGPGSRFVFTFLAAQSLSESARAAEGLALMGEPVRSTLAPKDLAGFLESRGFACRSAADHQELRRRYLAPQGLAERALDELTHLAVAERADRGA